jgi:pyrimidine deaminase RibD-like protein/NTP pyrophosphatase (non-canonical NTP hydrolase)
MTALIRSFLEEAIAEARLSRPEDEKPHPLVGAVVIENGRIIAKAHRGELAKGDHGEFTVLERKLPDHNLAGCTLVTTLEPCTHRNHPKQSCSTRLANRRIAKVYVGILDPNPDVYGNGVLFLRENNINVEMFPQDLSDQVRLDNKEFIELYLKPQTIDPKTRRLDDWYHTINSIYFHSNFYRDVSSIFSHLVEIMGGLSLIATQKIKPEVKPEEYMAKAMAWWLALCAKVGLRSVEELLWYKFPYVCPYCKRRPHDDEVCREAKTKSRNPNWRDLRNLGLASTGQKPRTLGAWQRMYGEIYPATQTESYEVIFGRFTEELGELAEAVRVGPVVPGYFLSEAADVFAWLMKLVNVYEVKHGVTLQNRGKRIEEAMYQQYPDKCRVCQETMCRCQPILGSTLGRIAHDGPDPDLLLESSPFMSSTEAAAFFEIGSVQIVLGSERLQVTKELVAEVVALVAYAASKINDMLERNPDALHHVSVVFLQMDSQAKNGRISDRHVQNLLRMISLLRKGERQDCLEMLKSAPKGSLQTALVGWLTQHLAALPEGNQKELFF